MLLSKTNYILYRDCPHNVWVKLHKPEEYRKFEISAFEQSLGVMGNEVERLARGMFPNGVMVNGRDRDAQAQTQKLITEHTPVIFQAVFATERYLAAADVLVWNSSAKTYDLYEIKMSSTTEEDDEEKASTKKEVQYEHDLAFQVNVLAECGLRINKKYLIRLNKDYVKHGELDFSLNTLFVQDDKTEVIDKLRPVVSEEMAKAAEYINTNTQPTGPCLCYYRGRSSHCTAFSYLNPEVPKYSVHDLNRIGNSKALLKELLDDGILTVDRVPEDRLPTPKPAKEGNKPSKPRKLNQVQVAKTQEPIIDLEAIKAELNSLTFPLYFLDYETYPTAIPIFDGYRPYQHIVFQYSLHVLTEADARAGLEPKHFEEIVLEGDPAEKIVESLSRHIGPVGSIISWYKKFENSRNRELAKTVPLQHAFLTDVIARTYDLMDIVEDQHYVHPGFEGRSSIKKVFPVLAPDEERSYSSLDVKNGTDAIEAYRKISQGEVAGQAALELKAEMLEYCKLDTKAMYVIWKFFYDMVKI